MPTKFGFDSLHQSQATGYVILGSASHVTENLQWHKDLLEFIIPKIESGMPTLGICFGHQLIAHHYGADVGYISEDAHQRKEARLIQFTTDELGFRENDKIELGYAHGQIVKSLPSNFSTFLKSDEFEFEGIKHNKFPYWGVQAHPEASINFLINDAQVKDESKLKTIEQNGHKLIQSFVTNASR